MFECDVLVPRARPEAQKQAASQLNATARANGYVVLKTAASHCLFISCGFSSRYRSAKEMKRKLKAEENALPPMVF